MFGKKAKKGAKDCTMRKPKSNVEASSESASSTKACSSKTTKSCK